MVVLNKAKGIRVGGGLVKTVTVGTKKIWPSRTITGYRVVATINSTAKFIDQVWTGDGEQKLFATYIGVEGLMIRAKGSSQMLPVTRLVDSTKHGIVVVKGNAINAGIGKGTVCELLAPIYAD